MQTLKNNPQYVRTIKEQDGYRVVSVQDGNINRHIARFRCFTCTNALDIPLSSSTHTPRQTITKKALEKKWGYKGKFTRWHCPACLERMASARKQMSETLSGGKEAPAAAPPAAPASPAVEPTGRQWHEVLAALEICYDAKVKRYNDKYTDQRVAHEISEPTDIVRYIREYEYGELAPDPKIDMLDATVAALAAQVAELAATVERQTQELSLLRHQTHKANPAAVAELAAIIEEAGLADLKTAVRTLQAQIGRTDVKRLDQLTKSLNLTVNQIKIEAVREDVAALLAHTEGRPLREIEADIAALRNQVRQGGVPPELADKLESANRNLLRPVARGVNYLPNAAHSHR